MRKIVITSIILCSIAFAVPVRAVVTLQPGFDQYFIENLGGGTFQTREWGIGVADFNGNLIPDIVSGDTSGDVHLFIGNGNGMFTEVAAVVVNQAFNNAYGLAVGDFNGDGRQDFVLPRTDGSTTPITDGQLHLYLGRGNGTFQSSGFPQVGIIIGDAGTDPISLAAGDVDADGDIDLISGDVIAGASDTAEVLPWRNLLVETGSLAWSRELIVAAVGGTPDPERPPYFPPTLFLHGFGLALGDVNGDGFPDLLVGDKAHYLYGNSLVRSSLGRMVQSSRIVIESGLSGSGVCR